MVETVGCLEEQVYADAAHNAVKVFSVPVGDSRAPLVPSHGKADVRTPCFLPNWQMTVYITYLYATRSYTFHDGLLWRVRRSWEVDRKAFEDMSRRSWRRSEQWLRLFVAMKSMRIGGTHLRTPSPT